MILVTGGTGLVGSHLLMELLQSGLKCKATCRQGSDLNRVSELFASYGPRTARYFSEIEWVCADLNDLPALETAFEGITEVYHCAALISFDPRDRQALRRINHEGTQNIVNLSLKKGVRRLYYCSSIATIGGIRSPLTENDLWDPADANVYATSKYLAEMEVWRGGQEGLETVIVNPGVILGPGFWEQGSGLFFSKTASGLDYAPPGGTGFVGVWDVVRAFGELAEKGCFNQRFILVSENLKYADLLSRIARMLHVPGPSKILRPWQLQWLWRLDWWRVVLVKSPRKLTRQTVRSLVAQNTYSSEKISAHTGFRFQPVDEVLQRCAGHFSKTD